MKVFVVKRKNKISWCEHYKLVVIAEDELHAERLARWNYEDFKKAPLEVLEINLDKEAVISAEYTGA